MDILQSALVILEQSCLYFPFILGSYLSISLMKLPDLSIEAAYAFGALLATHVIMLEPNVPMGLLLALVVMVSIFGGLVVGLVSSSLTRYAKIPHLLSSILTVGLFHGLNQLVLGSSMVSLSKYTNCLTLFDWFPKSPELPILVSMSLCLIVISYFFLKTQLGYSLAVFGNNPHFFSHYGIATNFVVLTGVAIANGLAGLSGYFVAQSSGFVEITSGHGMALFCITALILGKAFMPIKKFFFFGVPIIGTISYFIIMHLLLKIGFNQKYFTMLQALFVLLILMYKYRFVNQRTTTDNLGV